MAACSSSMLGNGAWASYMNRESSAFVTLGAAYTSSSQPSGCWSRPRSGLPPQSSSGVSSPRSITRDRPLRRWSACGPGACSERRPGIDSRGSAHRAQPCSSHTTTSIIDPTCHVGPLPLSRRPQSAGGRSCSARQRWNRPGPRHALLVPDGLGSRHFLADDRCPGPDDDQGRGEQQEPRQRLPDADQRSLTFVKPSPGVTGRDESLAARDGHGLQGECASSSTAGTSTWPRQVFGEMPR